MPCKYRVEKVINDIVGQKIYIPPHTKGSTNYFETNVYNTYGKITSKEENLYGSGSDEIFFTIQVTLKDGGTKRQRVRLGLLFQWDLLCDTIFSEYAEEIIKASKYKEHLDTSAYGIL